MNEWHENLQLNLLDNMEKTLSHVLGKRKLWRLICGVSVPVLVYEIKWFKNEPPHLKGFSHYGPFTILYFDAINNTLSTVLVSPTNSFFPRNFKTH